VERLPRQRQAGDFLPMDLGLRAARALSDRFGAQVLDYASEGRRSSITLRLPSRRELLSLSIERSKSAVAAALSARERLAVTVQSTEENRRRNHRLRTSLSEVRASLEAARLESRSIREGLLPGSAHGEI
jgi:hypothetical protein